MEGAVCWRWNITWPTRSWGEQIIIIIYGFRGNGKTRYIVHYLGIYTCIYRVSIIPLYHHTHTYRVSVVVGYSARYFHGLWWRVGIAYPVRLLGDSVGSRARSLGGGWGEPLSLNNGCLSLSMRRLSKSIFHCGWITNTVSASLRKSS